MVEVSYPYIMRIAVLELADSGEQTGRFSIRDLAVGIYHALDPPALPSEPQKVAAPHSGVLAEKAKADKVYGAGGHGKYLPVFLEPQA